MKPAVLFLARGVDGGMMAVDSFLASYEAHPAGCAHKLYVLAKGWPNSAQVAELEHRAHEAGATLISLPDDGYDWGAYFRAARQVSEEWLCCLNTHSRIERDGWLELLVSAATDQPNVGAVGCTASWGTILPSRSFIWPLVVEAYRHKGLKKGAYRLFASLVKFPWLYLRAVRHFAGFPNPHLRSNAFLTQRRLILSFEQNTFMPRTKNQALRLESGRDCFTHFLQGQGLLVLVVGADGRAFGPSEWRESHTFRVPGQQNLIVSDNQTRRYSSEDRESRRILEIAAWGRFHSP